MVAVMEWWHDHRTIPDKEAERLIALNAPKPLQVPREPIKTLSEYEAEWAAEREAKKERDRLRKQPPKTPPSRRALRLAREHVRAQNLASSNSMC